MQTLTLHAKQYNQTQEIEQLVPQSLVLCHLRKHQPDAGQMRRRQRLGVPVSATPLPTLRCNAGNR